MATPARLRMSRTALLPVLVLFVCTLPLLAAAWWGVFVLLIPVVAAVWVLRVGVDVDADAVTVRSLVGSRRVPWTEVAGIRAGDRGALWLVTTRRTEIRLPVLRARDLPGLAELSGGRIDVPAPPRR
ncbi:PH domain-containing protein [Blastococcus sp. URHD0036]|uniref:PH domain-containing protein n=1 Tax=Blastococcus sp. URHD0036 TaxID=1380356 RepID=UPI001E544226|nr:PH domain-containing protein [Blastococcus sp. URHD0036]